MEEWTRLIASELGEHERDEESADRVILRRQGACIEVSSGGVRAGSVSLRLSAVSSDAALARALVAIARAGVGSPIGRWHARPSLAGLLRGKLTWLDGVLARAGFQRVHAWPETRHDSPFRRSERKPRDGEAWWYRNGCRATVADGSLEVAYEREGWISSHELGTIGATYATVECSELPARTRAAASLLRQLVDLATHVARGARLASSAKSHDCRFCHEQFSSLHFHADLGSCHACAEQHLGILH